MLVVYSYTVTLIFERTDRDLKLNDQIFLHRSENEIHILCCLFLIKFQPSIVTIIVLVPKVISKFHIGITSKSF